MDSQIFLLILDTTLMQFSDVLCCFVITDDNPNNYEMFNCSFINL